MVFRNQVADFESPRYSIFTTGGSVSWRPVLLVKRESVPFFIYVSLVRHAYCGIGLWYVFLRSLATEAAQEVRHLRCKVTLRAASSSSPPLPPLPPGVGTTTAPPAAAPAPPPHQGKDSPIELTFTGPVHLHRQTNEEIIETGRFLFFRDEQVKAMAMGRTLFEYEVEVMTPLRKK